MKERNSSLLKMLRNVGKDPLSHDEWIAGWTKMYDELESTQDSSIGFSEIEHAALGSLSNVKISDTHAHLNIEVSRMLETFKHPALLVNGAGCIVAQNAMVRATYDTDIGDKIEKLPVILNCSESLQDVVKSVSNNIFSKEKAVFRQAFRKNSSHEVTVAITNSSGEKSTAALVFIISSRFNESAAYLVKTHYGLTTAECEILVSFVEGYSLKEIASDRERSHATIRTQFNSIMIKMDAHSQASLLRTALSLSDFTTEIDKFSAVLEHPFRRQANVMRDGGRMVDICFCGDPAGTPLLLIPTAATNRFNAKVEELILKAGLYLIIVSPPAYGGTDPNPSASSREQTQVNDVEAVLDMLNIDSCPLMVSNAGTYSAFHIAASLPARISRIVLLAACPPGDYWSRYGTGASWVDAVLRVGEKYPAVKKVIIAAGLKAWIAVGSKQFHQLQMAGNKKDIEVQMRPENVVEIEYALASATKFGFNAIMDDISAVFNDYSEKISHSSCDISIIHGTADSVLPIQSMRDFQADFPSRVELFEFNEVGFTLFLSHTQEVVNLLSQILSDVKTVKKITV